MRPPQFWTAPEHLASFLLWPASLAYGAAAALRLAAGRPARAAVPVICVGNLVAGGQGKTPAALALLPLLQGLGLRPAFLSRGYGGRIRGPVRVAARHSTRDVGDEPLLLARAAPTVVSADRAAGAALAVTEGADAIVMDDGFQNPSLAKDLSLLVADAAFGVGNGLMLPAGPLRAPLGLQLDRADALILIGDGSAGERLAELMRRRDKPVFRALFRIAPHAPALEGRRLIPFAGIGRPEKFFDTVERAKARVVMRIPFPDHHVYSSREAAALLDLARRHKADLITTEKDWVRLDAADHALRALKDAALTLPVSLVLAEPSRLTALVEARISRYRLSRDRAA